MPQNGMYPTISAGSSILSWRRPYARIADVERGDIVLFTEVRQGSMYLFVWRVIGLPGDRIVAAKDALSVNGSPAKRQLVRNESAAAIFKETLGGVSYEIAVEKAPRDIPPDVDLTVGADELFVMGDNRFNAVDSRYSGPIKFATIVGQKM